MNNLDSLYCPNKSFKLPSSLTENENCYNFAQPISIRLAFFIQTNRILNDMLLDDHKMTKKSFAKIITTKIMDIE